MFENIQIDHGNFTIDRSGAAFYTLDHQNAQLIKKDSGGSVIFSFFLAQTSQEVQSLQFDGVDYWALERAGNSGFRVRRWRIGSDNLVRIALEVSYNSNEIEKYDVNSMSVEFYRDELDEQVTVNDTVFDVDDGSVITIGDKITIGPSTATGFEGNLDEVIVINKVGNTITVSPPVVSNFSTTDEIYFTRNFFVFSDAGPTGSEIGTLYKYDAFTGALKTVNTSNLFNKVRGSTFFKNKLFFVRAGEAIWLDPTSQDIFKAQAIDNLNEKRGEYHITFDLAGFSDTLYRLEQQHVFFDVGLDRYDTEVWSPQYNYNTSSTLPEVYFVSVKADPSILHAAVTGLTPTSKITVQVLDQFRTPVFNRQVDLTSDGGPLNPIQNNTDADGIVKSVYTADSGVGEVKIEATVA